MGQGYVLTLFSPISTATSTYIPAIIIRNLFSIRRYATFTHENT